MLFIGCGVDTSPHVRNEPVMGTFVEITVMPGAVAGPDLDSALDAAFREIRRIDGLMSAYAADSEVSRINRLAPAESVRVSEDTFQVIARAIEICRVTQGAFDITVGPMLALWGFGSGGGDEHRVPSVAEIEDARSRTGIDHIVLDDTGRSVAFDVGGMSIDLSGIAKGYAVDRAVAVLREAGVTHALVNAGGDMAVIGGKSVRKPWIVGVQRPVRRTSDRAAQIIGTLELVGGAVATSGIYEQQFTVGDRVYSHIIDPRSGIPRERVPGITVIADDCTTADALATGLLVLGPEEGLGVVESLAGVDALFISERAGALTATQSSGWPARIDLARN